MIWSRLRNVFGSRPARPRRRSDERGMALVAVVFLGMLFTIMGLAVFALSGYEYGQATQRDDSGSAFWFADAAIEHAKAEIFNDITWDAGFDSVSLSGTDEGYYSLAIGDTVYDGEPATWMFARGFIRRPGAGVVERDVEVFARVSPAGFLYALFSMDSINTTGNVGVCGLVHGNDLIDDGGSSLGAPNDSSCEAETVLSDSFEVIPPGIRTEPSFYPNTTYYYVVGKPSGPYDRVIILRARVGGAWVVRGGITADSVGFMLDENGGNARVNYSGATIVYQFANTANVNAMFNQTTGVCSLRTGDNTVIVNFGEHLQGSAVSWISDLKLGDTNSFPNPVQSTVINTRYIENSSPQDVSIEALTNTDNWAGGNFEFQQIQMIPTNGARSRCARCGLPRKRADRNRNRRGSGALLRDRANHPVQRERQPEWRHDRVGKHQHERRSRFLVQSGLRRQSCRTIL